MAIKITGAWQQHEIDDFLKAATLPIRLSCVGADGYPRVVSLWFLYHSQSLFCVTQRSSQLAKLLNKNPRVGFEVAADTPPYCGVRGQSLIDIQPLNNDPALVNMLKKYRGETESKFSRWLLSRSDDEVILCIAPHRMFSWDYRERMSS